MTSKSLTGTNSTHTTYAHAHAKTFYRSLSLSPVVFFPSRFPCFPVIPYFPFSRSKLYTHNRHQAWTNATSGGGRDQGNPPRAPTQNCLPSANSAADITAAAALKMAASPPTRLHMEADVAHHGTGAADGGARAADGRAGTGVASPLPRVGLSSSRRMAIAGGRGRGAGRGGGDAGAGISPPVAGGRVDSIGGMMSPGEQAIEEGSSLATRYRGRNIEGSDERGGGVDGGLMGWWRKRRRGGKASAPLSGGRHEVRRYGGGEGIAGEAAAHAGAAQHAAPAAQGHAEPCAPIGGGGSGGRLGGVNVDVDRGGDNDVVEVGGGVKLGNDRSVGAKDGLYKYKRWKEESKHKRRRWKG